MLIKSCLYHYRATTPPVGISPAGTVGSIKDALKSSSVTPDPIDRILEPLPFLQRSVWPLVKATSQQVLTWDIKPAPPIEKGS